MARESFRKQHEDLGRLAREVLALTDPATLAVDATGARAALERLATRLATHSKMEDEGLYPLLLRHPDDAVRLKAAHLHDSFGPLYEAFLAFASRWLAPRAIEDAAAEYGAELRAVIAQLGQRISQENTELYTLVGDLLD